MNEPYWIMNKIFGVFILFDQHNSEIMRSCNQIEVSVLCRRLNDAFNAGREYERTLTEKRIHEREEL